MGIFTDLFSTKPAEEAAKAKQAGLQQGYDALATNYDQGRGNFSSDLGFGRDALTSNAALGNNALTSNYGAGRDAITSGYASGRDAINSGYSDASALYKPLLASTTAGANAYADATGVNGADGIARGGSTFKSLPGYSGGLTTGLDAVDRLAAAHGGFGGGNNTGDVIKYASDYDANKYGNYVSSLAPYLGANASAVSGAAGLDVGRGAALGNSYTGEGGALNSSYGAQGAGLNANYGNVGSGLNANYGALGSGVNSSYQGQGNAANANYTGQGNAQADADLAPYSASSNFWSALMGLGKMGASAASGGTGTAAAGGVPGTAIGGSVGATSLGGSAGPMALVGA